MPGIPLYQPMGPGICPNSGAQNCQFKAQDAKPSGEADSFKKPDEKSNDCSNKCNCGQHSQGTNPFVGNGPFPGLYGYGYPGFPASLLHKIKLAFRLNFKLTSIFHSTRAVPLLSVQVFNSALACQHSRCPAYMQISTCQLQPPLHGTHTQPTCGTCLQPGSMHGTSPCELIDVLSMLSLPMMILGDSIR